MSDQEEKRSIKTFLQANLFYSWAITTISFYIWRIYTELGKFHDFAEYIDMFIQSTKVTFIFYMWGIMYLIGLKLGNEALIITGIDIIDRSFWTVFVTILICLGTKYQQYWHSYFMTMSGLTILLGIGFTLQPN